MSQKYLYVSLALLPLLTSCFKTAEDIRREQMVDQMSTRLEESSKLVADLTQQVGYLQTRLDHKSGELEEKEHENNQKAQTFIQTTSQLTTQVQLLQEEVQNNKKAIAALESELNSQKKYITKVNTTLGAIASTPSADSASSKLAEAHNQFEKGKSKEATVLYTELINENKITAAQLNHVFYNMGMIKYREGKYDDALVYFSKIYTKYPRSSFSPKALLQIARSFHKQGKVTEAKATYAEVSKQYAGTPQAKDADKEAKAL